MWFLGLILGLIAGAALGEWGGAVAGGALGLFLGVWAGRSKTPTVDAAPVDVNKKIDHLFRALEDIHWRLTRLETQLNLGESPMQQAVSQTKQGGSHGEAAVTPVTADVAGVDRNVPPATSPGSMADATSPSRIAETTGALLNEEQAARRSSAFRQVLPADARAPQSGEMGDAPGSPDVPNVPNAPAASDAAVPKQSSDSIPSRVVASEPNVVWRWLTGGNTIARVGVLILFIGLAFLVKYATDNALLPIEFRLAGVGCGALALLVVGWRLRESRSGYALTLQGAGVAVLYLTIFAAYRLYHLLPPGPAFVFLATLAALSAMLALRQDAQALAVIGAAGGFLAPVLASSGDGSHVALFSYYALLNAGIFVIAWYRAWRPLNLVGFAFTFVIGLVWGARFYQPEFFATTEPFLVLFFLFYVGIAILYAYRQAPRLLHYVDGSLIFGVPIVCFGLQAGLVRSFDMGLAFSSFMLASFYLELARILRARRRPDLHLLVESFLALGVIFATLTLPLALDAHWTSAAWAVEGAGVYWVGVRQRRKLARAFAILLQGLAALAFLHGWDRDTALYPLANAHFVGAVLMSAAGFAIHLAMRREDTALSDVERDVSPLFFGWGLGWWLFGGLADIHQFVPRAYEWTAIVLFLTATVALFSAAHFRRAWREAAWPFMGFMPVLAVLALVAIIDHGHPFAQFGYVAWPLALAWLVALLRAHEPDAVNEAYEALHVGTFLLIAMIGAWEMHWLAREYDLARSAWSVASVLVAPCVMMLYITRREAASSWPVRGRERTYWQSIGATIVGALGVWTLYANVTHDGQSSPLPYLPLLNAIDLGHLFILIVVLIWRRRYVAADDAGLGDPFARTGWRIGAGVVVFVWLNAVLLRTLHHWADIPYRLERMAASVLVQTSLSIFWTLIALSLMLSGARKKLRYLWMLGAVLMAVVVGKLFMVDLSHIGGLERIVSFIVVGILMLVIGYVAPVPPKQGEAVTGEVV